MRMIVMSFIRKALKDERGQALPWMILGLVGLLGVSGFTIDAGHAYVVRSQLQNAANAAALAAAGNVYNTSSTDNATAIAGQYDGSSGKLNSNVSLVSATTTVTTKCLNLLMPAGTKCLTGSSPSPANAVQVLETASVPTFFMKILGISTIPIAAQATASMQGVVQPWNVAIIVDSTGSMNTADSNCTGGVTEFQCALNGVQTLLEATNPACPPGSSNCPTGATFRVALFTFPNVSVATAHMDYDCSGHPTAMPYTLPKPGQTLPVDATTGLSYLTYAQTSTGTQWNATYQITPFLSDYYDPTSTSTGGLKTSSELVKAVGYGGPSGTAGCLTYAQGIVNSGIGNTYFASAIYAAQQSLAVQQAANPGSKNAIIYLSDGQANLFLNQFPNNTSSNTSVGCNGGSYIGSEYSLSTCGTSSASQTGTVYLTPAKILAAQSSLGYDTLSTSSSGSGQSRSGSSKGIYPDWNDQCQQGIVAAQYATAAGTTVYGVAYGSESSGCASGWAQGLTDTTTVATGANVGITPLSTNLIPCTSIENIASTLSTFFSDYQQSGSGIDANCVDASHNTISLNSIFAAIAGSFTNPRLLPNNAS